MKMINGSMYFMADCMKELYKVPDTVFETHVRKYVAHNNELLGVRMKGFFFASHHYGSYDVGEKSPKLHESLHESFILLLVDKQDFIESLATVKHFLINTLNATLIVDDLVKILPYGLHQFIEGYAIECKGSHIPLSPEHLDAYVASKDAQINKIKEVLALNMLIG